MSKTYLAHAISVVDAACTYDANVKYLLADKQILAYILKYTVIEFQDMDVNEIISCIGDDLAVGTKSVDVGKPNYGRVQDSNTEDNVPGEGKIFYDIRFSAYLKEEMKFLINVEAQKSTDPIKLGYHLENRIQFYLSRMISAQKLTEFFNSDYDNLKKVRSIWICMDSSEDSDISEKKRLLTEKYGMVMTSELEGKVQTMCNWSEVIIERGIERGMERGIERGIEQGIKQERFRAIERMLKAGATMAQILSYGYTQEEFAEVESGLLANA